MNYNMPFPHGEPQGYSFPPEILEGEDSPPSMEGSAAAAAPPLPSPSAGAKVMDVEVAGDEGTTPTIPMSEASGTVEL